MKNKYDDTEPSISIEELKKGRYSLFLDAMKAALKKLDINNVIIENIHPAYQKNKKRWAFRVYKNEPYKESPNPYDLSTH